MWLRNVLVSTALLALAACATGARPSDEGARIVADAFASVDAATQTIYDQMEVDERARGVELAVDAAQRRRRGEDVGGSCPDIVFRGGFIRGFCPDDAYYFAEFGRPPLTTMFRSGTVLASDYTQILASFAGGADDAQLRASLGSSAGRAAVASEALQGAPPPMEEFRVEVDGLQPVLRGASVALDGGTGWFLAERGGRANARRATLGGAPHIREMLVILRAATPEMFELLVRQPTRVLAGTGPRDPAVAEAALRQIEATRRVVSNYVVLLDEMRSTLDALVASFATTGAAPTTTLINERATTIQSQATTLRQGTSALYGSARELAAMSANPRPVQLAPAPLALAPRSAATLEK